MTTFKEVQRALVAQNDDLIDVVGVEMSGDPPFRDFAGEWGACR